MNDSLKKAVFVFGVGYLIFWLFKPKVRKSFEVGKTAVQEVDPKERTPITEPTMSKSDAKANPTASKAFTLCWCNMQRGKNEKPTPPSSLLLSRCLRP
jgi:hypothetical protein